jgi:hypothetical protein
MGFHDPFAYLKHKLSPKEGLGIKLIIWLLTTKSQELPKFPSCRWHATYLWKFLDKGYNFTLDLISIGGLHTKLWALKVMGVSNVGISVLTLGSPETKWHLGVSPIARHRVYYKGEGVGFPQVEAMGSLVSLCLPVVCLCSKMLQLHTNQLVVWFVQVCVNDCLSFLLLRCILVALVEHFICLPHTCKCLLCVMSYHKNLGLVCSF